MAPAIEGFFFDGVTSRRHLVRVEVDAGGIALVGEAVNRRVAWSDCQLSERTRHGPRQIELGAGARLEIPDPAGFNSALAALGRPESVTVRMQQSWRLALGAVAGCVLAFAAAYQWLLPRAVEVVADRVPRAVLVSTSDHAVETIDQYLMGPSRMPGDRQTRLRERLGAIAPKDAFAEVLFRDGGRLGANALALPSGKIIVTDQLAALLNDDEIVGVLAHEIGHVVHRHGVRNVLQSSAVGLATAWLLGDVSSLLAGSAATFANLHYSRDFEYDADAYGASLLRANGMAPAALASALEKLEAEHGRRTQAKQADAAKQDRPRLDQDPAYDDYWSTHPATPARIKRLLTQED